MIKKILYTVYILLLSFCAWAQKDNNFQLKLNVGYFFRSTALEPIYTNPTVPFNYEKNLQGTGASFGIELKSARIPVSVEYFTHVRYDHFRYKSGTSVAGGESDESKQWFIDHNVAVKYYHGLFRLPETAYIGFEVNFLNSGAQFTYQGWQGHEVHKLHFTTTSLSLGFPINRLILEPKFSFAHFGSPYNQTQKFNFISVKAIYPINIISGHF